jgi:seryl-tRNA synthetase
MNQVNYQETVIIPALQKKIQDLNNANLVLEVSLLVEQAKSRDILSETNRHGDEVDKLRQELEDKNQTIIKFREEISSVLAEKNKLFAENNKLSKDLTREISVKESILGEYRTLKSQYDVLQKEINVVLDAEESYENEINTDNEE